MCLNRQVDSIRITLQRRNLHRIENGLVHFSVNRVKEIFYFFKTNISMIQACYNYMPLQVQEYNANFL